MSGQRGFTLLEVMVATAILGVSLATISGGLSMAVRSTALASGYERARQVAQNQLAGFLATRPADASQARGEADGVRWQLPDGDRPGLPQVVVEARFIAAGGDRWARPARGCAPASPATGW